jgi:hypothetical protein
MTDVYKIGITVALTNLIGSELTRIAKEFGVADTSAKGFGLALGGVAIAMAGVTAAMVAGINEARKFQVEVAKFQMFGLGDKLNNDAVKFAENMKAVGTSSTEAMKLMVEAQGVFRESGLNDESALRGAKLAAPMLAKIDYIGKSLDGESASKMHTSAQAMLRFIDMQGGLNDPERFNQIANAGFKAIRSSGGNIDWEQYRQFRARAASAGANLSDEALFGEMEPIIQELKGSTAGFSLRTAYNRLNGIIRLPNQAAHELIKIGAWDPGQIIFNNQGGIKSFKGNPLVDSDLFAKDPIAYYEKYILPYYNKQGLSSSERTRENALIFGSTGGNLFSIVERQNGAIHRSADAWNKAMGIDQSVGVAKGTFDGQTVILQAQWNTLMKDLGDKLLPTATKWLERLNGVLGGIIEFVEAPAAGKLMMLGGALPQQSNRSFSSLFHSFGSGSGDATPPSSSGVTTPVTVNMHIDGEVVARKTANVFLNGMSQAPSTGNDYDLKMSPLMPGYSAARGY